MPRYRVTKKLLQAGEMRLFEQVVEMPDRTPPPKGAVEVDAHTKLHGWQRATEEPAAEASG